MMTTILILNFKQDNLLPVHLSKTEWVADSVDPDQMPYSAAFDLGLHCLLKPASLKF